MKCVNCGKNEATYHYRSDINGNVTEKHLCHECAADGEHHQEFLNAQRMFGNMFGGLFENRRRMPSPWGGLEGAFAPWSGFGYVIPAFLMPRAEPSPEGSACTECGAPVKTEAEKVPASQCELDPEMCRRREINLLKRDMHRAAKNEDYEKAAELRDKIKEMEKSE